MFNSLIAIVIVLMMGLISWSLPVQAAQKPVENKITQASASQKSLTTKTVVLAVPGMTCPVCPITVKKALKNIKGVNHVSVNYKNKTATVSFDTQKVKISTLTEATKNVGYPSSLKTNSK